MGKVDRPSNHLSEFGYSSAQGLGHHSWIVPALRDELGRIGALDRPGKCIDLGCGNGVIAGWLGGLGFQVSAVDSSQSGIAIGKAQFPALDLRVGSLYDDLKSQFGVFPLVTSIDVIEHLYSPREFCARMCDLLTPGGYALLSTPYHGYIKNLAISLTNGWDRHLDPLWDHGHIKFWSPATLRRLFSEFPLDVVAMKRVGRIAPLAKSLLVTVRKR